MSLHYEIIEKYIKDYKNQESLREDVWGKLLRNYKKSKNDNQLEVDRVEATPPKQSKQEMVDDLLKKNLYAFYILPLNLASYIYAKLSKEYPMRFKPLGDIKKHIYMGKLLRICLVAPTKFIYHDSGKVSGTKKNYQKNVGLRIIGEHIYLNTAKEVELLKNDGYTEGSVINIFGEKYKIMNKKDGDVEYLVRMYNGNQHRLSEKARILFDAACFDELGAEYELEKLQTIDPNDKKEITILMHSSIVEMENFVAKYIREYTCTIPSQTISDEIIRDTIEEMQFTFNEDLFKAVKMALKNKVSIIKGEAGTGKTACIQVLHRIYNRLYSLGTPFGFRLCAFTGKAVQNIRNKYNRYDPSKSENSDRRSICQSIYQMYGGHQENFTTIHSLMYSLHSRKASGGNLFLIIEEASMVSTLLIYKLFNTMYRYNIKCHIIIVGDEFQLPPIEWGNFFTCLIDSQKIPTHRLTKNYRIQTESKVIIENANQYRKIQPVKFTNRQINWSGNFNQTKISIEDLIIYMYANKNNHTKNQIIAPFNSDKNKINHIAQKKFYTDNDPYQNYMGKKFYLEDKIIITKNFANQKVYNGTDGRIISINSGIKIYKKILKDTKETLITDYETYTYITLDGKKGYLRDAYLYYDKDSSRWECILDGGINDGSDFVECKSITIQTNDNQIIDAPLIWVDVKIEESAYEDEDDDKIHQINGLTPRNIDLAYCITTHKSQGSEYETVVFYSGDKCENSWDTIIPGRQSNIYTAITRTKNKFLYQSSGDPLKSRAVFQRVGVDERPYDRLRYIMTYE